MTPTLDQSSFEFPGQTHAYFGKVRDMYTISDHRMVAVVSDRISAFDVILPKGIPFKGQVLNGVASYFLEAVTDIVPVWKLATPHPNVTIGHACEPIRLEMVIRGYLTGHAHRTYASGKRMLCGVVLPNGMHEHDRFASPIITPATKAEAGHDEDISKEDILARGIVAPDLYAKLEATTFALFQRGTEMAAAQLSKEFVREWLIEQDFMGLEGQQVPDLPDDFVQVVSQRYISLYEQVTGKQFIPHHHDNLADEIHTSVCEWLKNPS